MPLKAWAWPAPGAGRTGAYGLAALANSLGFHAAEGAGMNDDEFDAVICAVTGCIPDCAIHGESLTAVIRTKLVKLHGQVDWISKVEPPDGYIIFDRLPAHIQIHVRWVDCPTPDALFAALCS